MHDPHKNASEYLKIQKCNPKTYLKKYNTQRIRISKIFKQEVIIKRLSSVKATAENNKIPAMKKSRKSRKEKLKYSTTQQCNYDFPLQNQHQKNNFTKECNLETVKKLLTTSKTFFDKAIDSFKNIQNYDIVNNSSPNKKLIQLKEERRPKTRLHSTRKTIEHILDEYHSNVTNPTSPNSFDVTHIINKNKLNISKLIKSRSNSEIFLSDDCAEFPSK